MGKHLFTSESVTEGHPDKICDQISDTILDALLEQDPNSRVAVETAVSTGLILVTGEVSSKAIIDIQSLVRAKVESIGYNRGKFGFDAENVGIIVALNQQSPDIAMGVDESDDHEQGAGDQGIMFGYATNETPEYMPIAITLAHQLTHKLAEVRKNGTLSYLRPDGKSQVTVEFDDNNITGIDTVVISTQHDENISQEQIHEDIINKVIKEVISSDLLSENTKYLVNPTGKFVIGGPKGDAGLTGRKIIVDTYGGWSRHGGGAFSGKDASKVDRSAAYAARYVAKNLVAAGFADRLEIQLSYAIGVADPISIRVDTFGTAKTNEENIYKAISETFDLRPKAIINKLELKRPIFQSTAAYGHFGRNEFTWEKLDQIENLKKYL